MEDGAFREKLLEDARATVENFGAVTGGLECGRGTLPLRTDQDGCWKEP